jgi:hypothetical protein
MSLCCEQDDRRDAVRRMNGRNGLDYVEVSDDQRTLTVFFLGKLPKAFAPDAPNGGKYLRIEGGQRVTDIQITSTEAVVDPNPEKDDYLVVKLNKYGDFSTYTLRLTGVANIDPRYDHVDFSFKVNCPSDLDCAAACICEPAVPPEPEINYLAKDYGSFRQLMFDRLAVMIPDWTERHVPDLGVALVEVLAYTGDYLSYSQDAVATEAYLDTARQRISVRRHARLVDYVLHEGCNARAWVCADVSSGEVPLEPGEVTYITGLNDALSAQQSVLTWDQLADTPSHAYEVFEPLVADRSQPIRLRAAHNEIHFYTWGEKECCLERSSTSATLLDEWAGSSGGGEAGPAANTEGARALRLQVGDVLIFEEVLGPHTGLAADADPARRHAVRLTKVTPGEDPVGGGNGRTIPFVQIEWGRADALPFPFCLSTIGDAPDCRYLDHVSVARGNVVLVDHGRTQKPEDLGQVPTKTTDAICECADVPGDIEIIPGRFGTKLQKVPLTFRQPLPRDGAGATPSAAAVLLTQDSRVAAPQVWLTSQPPEPWEPRPDLLASGPNDRHFVVEIDDDGIARLRFGDGELAYRPPAGMTFAAVSRVGNGTAGNVGAESISRLVLKNRQSGVSISVRNPLPARGGTAPEPIAEAKLFAPHVFRKRIERAVVAEDYEEIAERNPNIQQASAELEWSGSWYEADVAIDPVGREDAGRRLLAEIERTLERYRRMGHDLDVVPAAYVPLHLRLDVCARPHYERAHVKSALLEAFSTRTRPGGERGFFHPDKLTFGEGIYLSQIIATAQAVAGVESVEVTAFHRLFESPNHEIENGVLPLSASEIAQLDNDPNFPEHGTLDIRVAGGN